MSEQELEDMYLRSLDHRMSREENDLFLKELGKRPEQARQLAKYKRLREMARQTEAATFGPYFAAKLVYKIQNAGVVVDRQIFSFFRKFQLVALGVVVALVVINVLFSENGTVKSVLGIEETITENEEIVSFDFFESLNK